jgi:hypothetical protein
LLLAVVFALPNSARAADLTVVCPGGAPGAFASINDAVNTLDPNLQGHTITIEGTCTENVFFGGRRGIQFVAPPGQTATVEAADPSGAVFFVANSFFISFQRLVIRGGRLGIAITSHSDADIKSCRFENNTFAGLNIADSSFVRLGGPEPGQGVVFTGNRNGIVTDGSGLTVGGGLTVENSVRNGIFVQDTRLLLFSGSLPGTENVIRNNGTTGVVIANGSTAEFGGLNTIHNNGTDGVAVTHNSFVNAFETVIENNGRTGMLIVEQSQADIFAARIRGNGTGTFGIRAGLRITENAQAFIVDGTEIANNGGPGVHVETNAVFSSLGGNTISNNSEPGVRLVRESIGHFFGPDTVAGNGTASVACDATSLLAGDLSSLSNLACNRIEREIGPPRPGHSPDLPEPPQP